MTKKSIKKLLVAAACLAVLGGSVGAFSGCIKHVHIWEDVTTPATCSSTGKVEQVCKLNPAHRRTIRELDKLPHKWEVSSATPATCSADGQENLVCKSNPTHTDTKKITVRPPHTVDSWTVIKEAGPDWGKQTGTCTTCAQTVTRESGEKEFGTALAKSKDELTSDKANHRLTAEASVKLNDSDAYSVSATAAIVKDLLSYNAKLTDYTATREADKNQNVEGVVKFKDFDGIPGIMRKDGFDFPLLDIFDADDLSVEISKSAAKLLFGEGAFTTMGSLTSLDGFFFGRLASYYAEFKQTDNVYSLDKAGFIHLLETELRKPDYTKIDAIFEKAVPDEEQRADVIAKLTEMGIMKTGKFDKDGIIALANKLLEELIKNLDVSLTVHAGKVTTVSITAKIEVPPEILEAFHRAEASPIDLNADGGNTESAEPREALKIDVAARVGIEYGGQEIPFNPLPALPTPGTPNWTEDGKLSFAKDPNAGGLKTRVLRDGKVIHGYYIDSSSDTVTIYGDVLKEPGTYSVQARAYPNDKESGYSEWSKAFTFTLEATDAPSNIRLADGIISWEGAAEADIELRLINRSDKSSRTYNTRDPWCKGWTDEGNNAVFDLKNKKINLNELAKHTSFSVGTYEISIRILAGDNTKANSEWAEGESFTVAAVDAPTNVALSDGFLSWDGADNADIELQIVDSEGQHRFYNTKSDSYVLGWRDDDGNPVFDLESKRINLNGFAKHTSFPAGTYEIKIKILAPADDYTKTDSDWAVGGSFTLAAVDAPTNVTLSDDGFLSWDGAEGADIELRLVRGRQYYRSYNTRKDSNILEWKDTDGSPVFDLTNKKINFKGLAKRASFSAGTYEIKIKILRPLGDNTKTDSEWADGGTFTVTAMAAPTNVILSDAWVLSWDGEEGADIGLQMVDGKGLHHYYNTGRNPSILEWKDADGNPVFDLKSKRINFKGLAKRDRLSVGTYNITMCILKPLGDYTKTDSAWAVGGTFAITAIDAPTNVTLSDAWVLSWDGEDSADIELSLIHSEGQYWSYNTRENSSVLEWVDDDNNPVFDLENKKINFKGLAKYATFSAGAYEIKIKILRPLGDYTKADSEWTDGGTFTVTAVDAPTHVALNDDGFLSWDGADGADIELRLLNGKGEYYTSYNTEEDSYVLKWKDTDSNSVFDLASRKINFNELAKHTSFSAGAYEIKIKILKPLGDYTKADSEWTDGGTFTVTAVDAPTNVLLTDGFLSWDGAEGADIGLKLIDSEGQYCYYSAREDSLFLGWKDTDGNPVFDLASRKINFNELAKHTTFSADTYEIKIRILAPAGEFTKADSEWADGGSFTVTAVAAPTHVTLGDDGFLSWDGMDGADIGLKIIHSEGQFWFYDTKTNPYILEWMDDGSPVFDLTNKKINFKGLAKRASFSAGMYEIKIRILRPLGDFTKTDSEWADGGSFAKTAVNAPTNVTLSNEWVLSWDGMDGADIGLRIVHSEGQYWSYNTREDSDILEWADDDGNSVFDLASRKINFNELAKHTSFSAGAYEIKIKILKPLGDYTKADSEWTDGGSFAITAVDAPTNVTLSDEWVLSWDGEDSADIELSLIHSEGQYWSYNTRENSSVLEWVDDDNNPVFDLKNKKINFKGLAKYATFSAGTYEIKIKILAPADDYAKADSEWADGGSFTVTAVDAPTNVALDGDGILSWEDADGANIELAFTKSSGSGTYYNTGNSTLLEWKDIDGNPVFDLTNRRINLKEIENRLSSPGVYEIKIKTLAPAGDFAKTDSEWVPVGSFTKTAMDAPTNVTLSDEWILSWDGETGADIGLLLVDNEESYRYYDTREDAYVLEWTDADGNPVFDLTNKKINFKGLIKHASLSAKAYGISIKILAPVGDYTKADSEQVSGGSFSKTAVAAPTNVIFTDGILAWEGEEDADIELRLVDSKGEYYSYNTRRGSYVLEWKDTDGNPVFDLKARRIRMKGFAGHASYSANTYELKIKILAPADDYTKADSEWAGNGSFTATAVDAPTNAVLQADGFLSWDGLGDADIELQLTQSSGSGYYFDTRNSSWCKRATDGDGQLIFDLANKRINFNGLVKHRPFSVGVYELKIKILAPLGDYTKVDSAWTDGGSLTVAAVDAPTNVAFQDGILSWDGTAGADIQLQFVGSLGGSGYFDTTIPAFLEWVDAEGNPAFDLENRRINFNALARYTYFSAEVYEIKIKILAGAYTKVDSAWADGGRFTVTAVDAPTHIVLQDDGFLSWDGADGADIELQITSSSDPKNFSTKTAWYKELKDTDDNLVFDLTARKINLRELTEYYDSGVYEIKIRAFALPGDYTKGTSLWADGGSFTKTEMDAPTHVALGGDGFLSWDGADGADIELRLLDSKGEYYSSYYTRGDSSSSKWIDADGNPVFDLKARRINFNELAKHTTFSADVYQIKIKILAPLGDYTKVDSAWTDGGSFTVTAGDAPTNVTFQADEGLLSWDGLGGVDIELRLLDSKSEDFISYNTRNSPFILERKGADGNPIFDLKARRINIKGLTEYITFSANTYEIKIKILRPLGDYTKADSEWASGGSLTVTAVDAPTNISVNEDRILSWDGADGADIELRVNMSSGNAWFYGTRQDAKWMDAEGNPVFDLTARKINLREIEKQILTPGVHEIQFRLLAPAGDYTVISSEWVTVGNFTVIGVDAPTHVSINDDGILSWDGEAGANIKLRLNQSSGSGYYFDTRNNPVLLERMDAEGNPIFDLAARKINLRALARSLNPAVYEIKIKILVALDDNRTKGDSEWVNVGTFTVEE